MQRHPIPRGRIAVLVAICSVCLSACAQAQLSSITTKLLGRIDSGRMADGAPFFVKTISAWKQGHCSVPMGATLEGRVTRVVKRGPGVKWEEVDLRFLRIPCPTDDAQEIIPLLVAIHGPRKNSNDDMLARDVIMTAFASVWPVRTRRVLAFPAARRLPVPLGPTPARWAAAALRRCLPRKRTSGRARCVTTPP